MRQPWYLRQAVYLTDSHSLARPGPTPRDIRADSNNSETMTWQCFEQPIHDNQTYVYTFLFQPINMLRMSKRKHNKFE